MSRTPEPSQRVTRSRSQSAARAADAAARQLVDAAYGRAPSSVGRSESGLRYDGLDGASTTNYGGSGGYPTDSDEENRVSPSTSPSRNLPDDLVTRILDDAQTREAMERVGEQLVRADVADADRRAEGNRTPNPAPPRAVAPPQGHPPAGKPPARASEKRGTPNADTQRGGQKKGDGVSKRGTSPKNGAPTKTDLGASDPAKSAGSVPKAQDDGANGMVNHGGATAPPGSTTVVQHVILHRIETVDRKRNRAEVLTRGTYVWKALSEVGRLFFAAITTPLKAPGFREFVRGHRMEIAPPLEYRTEMVKEAYGTDYTKTVDAICANKEIDWTATGVKAVLVELAALWSVTRNILSPVTLRVYLYLGQTNERLAMASSESALKDLPLSVSHVTNLMLRRVRNTVWGEHYSGMSDDILSGEIFRCMADWETFKKIHHASLAATQVARVPHTPARQGPPPRSASNTPRARAPSQFGSVNITRVCGRCLYSDHRRNECTKAAHPQFRPNEPMWLLREASHGRIPLPQ